MKHRLLKGFLLAAVLGFVCSSVLAQISGERTKDYKVTNHPSGVKEVVYANGHVQIQYPDGTLEHRYVGGHVEVRHPDGTVEQKFKDGHLEVIHPTGTVEQRYKGGHVEVIFPGGTVERRYVNGHVEVRYVDGTIEHRPKDGKVVMTPPGQMPKVPSKPVDGFKETMDHWQKLEGLANTLVKLQTEKQDLIATSAGDKDELYKRLKVLDARIAANKRLSVTATEDFRVKNYCFLAQGGKFSEKQFNAIQAAQRRVSALHATADRTEKETQALLPKLQKPNSGIGTAIRGEYQDQIWDGKTWVPLTKGYSMTRRFTEPAGVGTAMISGIKEMVWDGKAWAEGKKTILSQADTKKWVERGPNGRQYQYSSDGWVKFRSSLDPQGNVATEILEDRDGKEVWVPLQKGYPLIQGWGDEGGSKYGRKLVWNGKDWDVGSTWGIGSSASGSQAEDGAQHATTGDLQTRRVLVTQEFVDGTWRNINAEKSADPVSSDTHHGGGTATTPSGETDYQKIDSLLDRD